MDRLNRYIRSQKETDRRPLHLAANGLSAGFGSCTLLLEQFSNIVRGSVHNSKKIALLMCGINNCHERSLEDAVLQEVNKKLELLAPKNKIVTRYNGDGFILILEQMKSTGEVLENIDIIKSAFPIMIELEGESFDLTLSIGHACLPDEGTTIDQLIALAEVKMCQAKERYYGF